MYTIKNKASNLIPIVLRTLKEIIQNLQQKNKQHFQLTAHDVLLVISLIS